ncbi:MAG: glycoside hydrolase family 97 protein [Woeseiaceae bacterium]|nr:glycoside hydrolase family 97 protein [Woeseiaceae bacterium]
MRLGIGVFFALLSLSAGAEGVSSPDGSIRFELSFAQTEDPSETYPVYTVTFDDEEIIRPSRLGLRADDRDDFSTGLSRVTVARKTSDTTWEQPWGERRFVRDHNNQAIYTLRFDAFEMAVHVRVFDDGLAFRYAIPEQDGLDIRTVDELTQFVVNRSGTAFWQTGDGHEGYEHLYQATDIDDVTTAHTPITLRLDTGTHLSFHEAALIDYPAYRLIAQGDGRFDVDLRPWSDGTKARVSLPFLSPWRTIQLARSATGLLDSDLILNLNEPNVLGDVSWVEPGKYAGIWWEIHRGLGTWSTGPRHAATTAAAKAKIDFAAEYGFDGVLAEGWNIGWDGDWVGEPIQDLTRSVRGFDLPAVARYARDSGVRLVGHQETGGHVTHYEKQMDAAFDLLERHGVRQVKTGYVGRTGSLKRVDDNGVTHFEHKDGQFAVRHHMTNILKAAERRISINTHEPVKDTGLRRTYPNWLSREGSRGQEFNVWGDPGNPPEHEVMLAYTRLLSGPMDFTPGVFDLDFEISGKPRRVQTTLAKQLALYVTIYSPIQMVPDMRENYERYRDAFQFIVDVPTDWEESVALAGEVGDFVAFARKERGGDDWYLGAITDEQARDLSLPLGFLDDGQSYRATIYSDGPDAHWETSPYEYVIRQSTVNNKNTLELKLAPGGGAAIRFEPEE